MHKKFNAYLLSIVAIIVLLGNSVFIVGAESLYQDDINTEPTKLPNENPANELFWEPDTDTPGGITDGTFTFLDPPYLSEDGTTLYNVDLPRVLVLDTNPEMQNLHFPRDPEVTAAIAGTRTARASFDITYKSTGTEFGLPCSLFPEAAKSAFNAAAAIWASQIQSTVPITIVACWTNGLPSGVLGGSGGGSWHRDFPGAPQPNTWYQAALANSLAGSDLDPTNADMHIVYSSTFSWYYGTDGNTPSGLVDLVSVAAHEIAHGLHFTGMMVYNTNGTATYGYIGYPSIYETFMESLGGTKLTSYTNSSTALGALVTSNNLWWNGPNANAANGGGRVKMYAPSTWSSGSSYSHLDYDTFRLTINSLMVYAIGSGTSQHNPGPVTIGLFKDMGWRIGNPPPTPTGVSASDGAFADKVRVTWGDFLDLNHQIYLPLILSGSGGTGPLPEAPYFQVYRNTSNSTVGASQLVDHYPASPFDDTSAVPGTQYYYWVKACNSAGCSGFSESDDGYRASEITAPSPPTGVSASDGTYTDKVQVSWTDLVGATYYEVYRHTSDDSSGAGSPIGSQPSSPYDDASAVAETPYFYWVKACNSAGCSGFSESDDGYRASEITVPSPPTGVSASDGTFTDKVQISWNPSPGATYYKVFRNTSDGAEELPGSPSSSPYDDTTAVAGTTYNYWVVACNSAGWSDYSDTDTGWRASDLPIPQAPTWVDASDGIYAEKVLISWSASEYATDYQVFRNTTDVPPVGVLAGPVTTSYEDTEAIPETHYYYWVKACNVNGCSDFSPSDQGWSVLGSVANGDFEAGRDGSWTEYSSGGYYLIYGDVSWAHSGTWIAYLGGYNNAIDQLSQDITISSLQSYLHFWIYVDSEEEVCGNDVFYITIDDTRKAYLNICTTSNTYGWAPVVWDISAYAGTSVNLMFEVITNGLSNSYVYLDDISLSSSSTAALMDISHLDNKPSQYLDKDQLNTP